MNLLFNQTSDASINFLATAFPATHVYLSKNSMATTATSIYREHLFLLRTPDNHPIAKYIERPRGELMKYVERPRQDSQS